MNKFISREEVLLYLYRTKECLDESDGEPEKRYFRHCIMSVANLALRCGAIEPEDIQFYKDIFQGSGEITSQEKVLDFIWG